MVSPQILITGAAGFIGSNMVQFLNEKGYSNLIIVDDFLIDAKKNNWVNSTYSKCIQRDDLLKWLQNKETVIQAVIHLGARTDTTEFDYPVHEKLNVQYSKMLWSYCVENKVPFVYASSAATYGKGEQGYADDHGLIPSLKPLNPYGVSKHVFDLWALEQSACPHCWVGLKFFNVYGPNEYHKGRMASVIWHAFNQIQQTGLVKLFKSHRKDFKDGEQLRDFIYVRDVVDIIGWILMSMLSGNWVSDNNGIITIGTGKARTFYDLVVSTFNATQLTANITFIDMPADIRETYQYFTEAKMEKLKKVGYKKELTSLEVGVNDYVTKYLLTRKIHKK